LERILNFKDVLSEINEVKTIKPKEYSFFESGQIFKTIPSFKLSLMLCKFFCTSMKLPLLLTKETVLRKTNFVLFIVPSAILKERIGQHLKQSIWLQFFVTPP
jgi:hypothetical protein